MLPFQDLTPFLKRYRLFDLLRVWHFLADVPYNPFMIIWPMRYSNCDIQSIPDFMSFTIRERKVYIKKQIWYSNAGLEKKSVGVKKRNAEKIKTIVLLT